MKKIVMVFAFIGVGLLAGAFFSFKSTRNFLAAATKTSGKVTELEERVSTSTKDGRSTRSLSYYPRVQFSGPNGEEINFTSSVGSSPASYDVGESVEVLYLPQAPQQAKINSFSSL